MLNSTTAENWCVTKMNIVKLSYTWTINNFSYCVEAMGKFFKSSTFSADSPNDQIKWYLRICPKGEDEESNEYVSLFLSLKECNKNEVHAKYKISILNANEEKTETLDSKQTKTFNLSRGRGRKKFIRRDYLLEKNNGLLPDDKLTVYCEVSFVADDIVNVMGHGTVTLPECRLVEDFSQMFEEMILGDDSKIFSDCTLNINGRQLPALKAILAARCRVFKAMFVHETMERELNVVNITDIDYNVLKEMLRFIYTGAVPNLHTMAEELLVAADKYALEDLKIQCRQALGNKLTVDNVCEMLILADFHSAEQLMQQCLSFIKGNATDVMNTPGWKTTAGGDHSRLMTEIVKSFVTQ